MSHVSKKLIVFQVLLFLITVLSLYTFTLRFLSEEDLTFSQAWNYQQELFQNDKELAVNAMFLDLTFQEPNAELQQVPIVVKPWAMGNRAVSISNILEPLNDIDLVVDLRLDERVAGGDTVNENLTGAYGKTQGNQVIALETHKRYGPFQGVSSVSVVDNKSIRAYPFDQYEGWMLSWANYYANGRPAAMDPSQMSKVPLGATMKPTSLGTFKASIDLLDPHTYEPIVQNQDQLSASDKEKIEAIARKNAIAVGYTFQRDASTRFLTLLVFLIILLSTISVIAITFFILRGIRPPSLNATIWAIAVVFTTIQIRSVLPGKPPIGIWLDIAIFFPALIFAAISAGTLVVLWLQREDFHV